MDVNEKGLLGFAAPEGRGSGIAPGRREQRVNRAVNRTADKAAGRHGALPRSDQHLLEGELSLGGLPVAAARCDPAESQSLRKVAGLFCPPDGVDKVSVRMVHAWISPFPPMAQLTSASAMLAAYNRPCSHRSWRVLQYLTVCLKLTL